MIADHVETLTEYLDRLDPDPDLEPSLGFYNGSRADCDLEADFADDELILGALGNTNQERWSKGYNGGKDAVADDSDLEDGGEDELTGDELEPSLGSLDAVDDQRGWNGGVADGREMKTRIDRGPPGRSGSVATSMCECQRFAEQLREILSHWQGAAVAHEASRCPHIIGVA